MSEKCTLNWCFETESYILCVCHPSNSSVFMVFQKLKLGFLLQTMATKRVTGRPSQSSDLTFTGDDTLKFLEEIKKNLQFFSVLK